MRWGSVAARTSFEVQVKVTVSRNPLQDVEQLLCSLYCTCYGCCVVSVREVVEGLILVVSVREVVEGLILAIQPGEKLTVGCEFLVHVVHHHTMNYAEEVW